MEWAFFRGFSGGFVVQWSFVLDLYLKRLCGIGFYLHECASHISMCCNRPLGQHANNCWVGGLLNVGSILTYVRAGAVFFVCCLVVCVWVILFL